MHFSMLEYRILTPLPIRTEQPSRFLNLTNRRKNSFISSAFMMSSKEISHRWCLEQNFGIGEEGNRFLRRLSELLSVKENETYAHVMTWLRTKLSFEILKSVHLSVRGSRTPFKKTVVNNEVVEDFNVFCILFVYIVGIVCLYIIVTMVLA